MLEIIALIFLCKRNGALATTKGLKPGTWKMYTILAWIVAEFIGIGIGISMFGKQNLLTVGMVGTDKPTLIYLPSLGAKLVKS